MPQAAFYLGGPHTLRSVPSAQTGGSRIALARLELTILIEETLARFPDMELAGQPAYAESPFINQLKTLPVRLRP